MALSPSANLRILIVLVVCCSVLLLAGCSNTNAAPAAPPLAVEVATVVQQDTPIYSEWVATLDGFVNAQIQPRVA
jgi:membrane fusion protein (multidrug efflux system)